MNFFKPEDYEHVLYHDRDRVLVAGASNAKLERECVVVYGIDNGVWCDDKAAVVVSHEALIIKSSIKEIKQESCADVLEGWANACNGSGIIAWEHWQARAKAALARESE